jgi:hypothetical protein
LYCIHLFFSGGRWDIPDLLFMEFMNRLIHTASPTSKEMVKCHHYEIFGGGSRAKRGESLLRNDARNNFMEI